MGFLRRHAFWLCFFLFMAGLICAPGPETARTRIADGFDLPVGKPDAEGYYKSRGFRANYHMGEDWNGVEGGNKDLGKPVYTVAHGIVVMARDMRMSWGNLVIIRHIYLEEGRLKTVDSVYAHLDRIMVKEGQQVTKGQQVGTIGTAHGLYPAHLHFEIRKNLNIGYNQRGFPRGLDSYYLPTPFINARRKLPGAGRSAQVAINTFPLDGRAPSTDDGGRQNKGSANPVLSPTPAREPGNRTKPFRVNRFDDLLSS